MHCIDAQLAQSGQKLQLRWRHLLQCNRFVRMCMALLRGRTLQLAHVTRVTYP